MYGILRPHLSSSPLTHHIVLLVHKGNELSRLLHLVLACATGTARTVHCSSAPARPGTLFIVLSTSYVHLAIQQVVCMQRVCRCASMRPARKTRVTFGTGVADTTFARPHCRCCSILVLCRLPANGSRSAVYALKPDDMHHNMQSFFGFDQNPAHKRRVAVVTVFAPRLCQRQRILRVH